MELIENIEETLQVIASLVKFFLEALGIFTILVGTIVNGRRAMLLIPYPRQRTRYIRIRSGFGRSLTLALEFQLGADIVGTVVAPSFEALGKLAAVAVIRTFLNYFLAKELEELKDEEKFVDTLEDPKSSTIDGVKE